MHMSSKFKPFLRAICKQAESFAMARATPETRARWRAFRLKHRETLQTLGKWTDDVVDSVEDVVKTSVGYIRDEVRRFRR